MRRHLNTLYVTTEGAWLRKDGENIVVKIDGDEIGRAPFHILGSVVCFGSVGASPSLMGACGEKGVTVVFLRRNGRFLARVEGPVKGNVLLRRRQYRVSDDESEATALSRMIIAGKLFNQRAVVRRGIRDHSGSMDDDGSRRLETADKRLTHAIKKAFVAQSLDGLRGVEGDGAKSYNKAFNDLITVDDDAFVFAGRTRRPPLDPVNALLSFLYTLAIHDYRSALETVGLDPAVGFLHRDRPGRPGLALDLVEEVRPSLADRLALTLINRRQVTAKDFETSVSGAVTLMEASRKNVLIAYQNRKRDEITHPFLNEKTTLGLVPFLQAQLLSRHLRGDLNAYPPYQWR